MKNNDFITEYVEVNGIKQFLMTYQNSDKAKPVMLFLHGGPGMAESVFAHAFSGELKELYTIVYWDQRGAGKTLSKNKKDYPNWDKLFEDLELMVDIMKEKYKKDKIVILGHSFGSILGSYYALSHPENVLYYIGAGQVISIAENERTGYEKLKDKIIEAKNNKDLLKLKKIGAYPENNYTKTMIHKIQKVRILQGKYGIGMNFIPIIKTLLRSPIFQLSDIASLIKGMSKNVKLWDFMFSHSLESETKEYRTSVYYILGENDCQAPRTIAEKYFNEINAPQKQLFQVEKAGHFMMLDQPELFCKAVRSIVDNQS